KLPHPEPTVATRSKINFTESFRSFIFRPGMGKAIAFILLFKVGDNFLFNMAPPFLLDAGMTVAQLGFFSGTLASGSFVLGAILGGWIVARKGLNWGLWRLGLAQNLS